MHTQLQPQLTKLHEASWGQHKGETLCHGGSHHRRLLSVQLNMEGNQTRTEQNREGRWNGWKRWNRKERSNCASTASKSSKKGRSEADIFWGTETFLFFHEVWTGRVRHFSLSSMSHLSKVYFKKKKNFKMYTNRRHVNSTSFLRTYCIQEVYGSNFQFVGLLCFLY